MRRNLNKQDIVNKVKRFKAPRGNILNGWLSIHTTSADSVLTQRRRVIFRWELTAELVEVRLDLPPGVQEHSASLRSHGNHAVLVHRDTCHLGVELSHRHALEQESNTSHQYHVSQH